MGTARLFVAVWPDAGAAEALRLLHRKDQPGVRFVPEENWHITLRFLGQADSRPVTEALAGVRVEPVEVFLGPVVELLSDHSVIVPAGGLQPWATAVNRVTGGLGEAPIRRRFVGHVTLARLSGRARRHQVQLPGVVGTPVAAAFVARQFSLVASHLRPEGARYEVLERFEAGA